MQKALNEMAEFAGRACGIIARDLAEVSRPLAAAFRRGWHSAWQEEPAPNSEPEIENARETA